MDTITNVIERNHITYRMVHEVRPLPCPPGARALIPIHIERADGLDCEVALRTARHLIERSGGNVLPGSRGFTLAASGAPTALDEAERLCALVHGFRCSRDGFRLFVDVAWCPADTDTVDERNRLINQLERAAGRDAEAAWHAGRDDHNRAAEAYSSADEEGRWCNQQTTHFLRGRIAS